MERNVCREIKELHSFLQSWFRGEVEETEEEFYRFSGVLALDFHFISPDGRIRMGQDVSRVIREKYGVEDPDFKIWIDDCRARDLGANIWIATYEEWQQRNGQTRARLTTAVFRPFERLPNGLEWVHVHEVWLPRGGE